MEVGAVQEPLRAKKSRATPKRKQHKAAPGAVYASDALAANTRDYRRIRDWTQEQLADRMNALGYEWSAGVVGFLERGDRTLTVDELFALALTLGVDLPSLLDPTGVNGTGAARVHVGSLDPLPAVLARHWLRGAVKIVMREPGDFELHLVPGHDSEYAEAAPAFGEWIRARAAEHVAPPAIPPVDQSIPRDERLRWRARRDDQEQG
jgi:transcriptional regulator with XRE-family HTH domain